MRADIRTRTPWSRIICKKSRIGLLNNASQCLRMWTTLMSNCLWEQMAVLPRWSGAGAVWQMFCICVIMFVTASHRPCRDWVNSLQSSNRFSPDININVSSNTFGVWFHFINIAIIDPCLEKEIQALLLFYNTDLTWMFTLSMTQEMTWSTCILVSHSVTCCNNWNSSPKMDSRY